MFVIDVRLAASQDTSLAKRKGSITISRESISFKPVLLTSVSHNKRTEHILARRHRYVGLNQREPIKRSNLSEPPFAETNHRPPSVSSVVRLGQWPASSVQGAESTMGRQSLTVALTENWNGGIGTDRFIHRILNWPLKGISKTAEILIPPSTT